MSAKRDKPDMTEELQSILPSLWRFAVALCGDTKRAGDLFDLTYERAMEASDPDMDVRLSAYAIMADTWTEQFGADLAGGYSSNGGGSGGSFLAHRLLDDLQSLPPSQQVTVSLVYIEGLTYEETSDVLDISVEAVGTRLASARKLFAQRSQSGPASPPMGMP